MPFVEELPNTAAHAAAPGWAYVLDTGYDPSKAAIVPSGSRSRQARSGATGGGGGGAAATAAAATARQQNRIAKRLAALEKENHRDVAITVPSRAKDTGGRGLRGKMTTGVKRILMSDKNVAHHLADEEAAIANHQYQPIEPFPRTKPRHPIKKKTTSPQALKKSSKAAASAPPPTEADSNGMEVDQPTAPPAEDVEMENTDDLAEPDENLDEDPLLKVDLPAMPSEEEIEALVSSPPLPYSAAKAAPTSSSAPSRQFCEMCGYWGRARCMKCGVRVCSLDCKIQHDETSCMKFYA